MEPHPYLGIIWVENRKTAWFQMGIINRGWAKHLIWSIYTTENSEAIKKNKANYGSIHP